MTRNNDGSPNARVIERMNRGNLPKMHEALRKFRYECSKCGHLLAVNAKCLCSEARA